MNMKRKNVKFEKKCNFEIPEYEDVNVYIKRLKNFCNDMKKDFPGFLTYKFKIDIGIDYKWGDYLINQTIKMICDRKETDKEMQNRKMKLLDAKKAHAVKKIKEKEKEIELLKKLAKNIK